MSRWKNERAIEETVRSGPELNLLLMKKVLDDHGMAWVGRLPIPRHATAQYQYKLTTHRTAQHDE